jgi:hypothetical protein
MNKWRKLRGLSWPERRLLAQAAVALPAVAALIRLRGLRQCQTFLARLAPVGNNGGPVTGESAEALARTVARMVRAAAAYGPYRANCLQRSVALWWFLRRRGLASDVRIGTRTRAGRFEAHAWVEFGGVALNERRDVRADFTPFDRSINPPEARYS